LWGAKADAGEGSGEEPSAAAAAASYMETHDLVYAKDRKRFKVKTHREVETILSIHFWKPTTEAPVNGWVDYSYEPPNTTDEIRPLATLPAPSLNVNELDPTPRVPPPSPDDWKLAFFHASLDCVREFAARVNSVTGDEIFVVQEKPFYWIRTMSEETSHERKPSL